MPDVRLRVSDPGGSRVVLIDKSLFTIGRGRDRDLKISGLSADVSRDHAEIVFNGDQYILRDRGSTYGTLVNGERITEHTLSDGDLIVLGRGETASLMFESHATSPSGFSRFAEASSELTDLRQLAAIMDGLRALGSGRVLNDVLMLVVDSALEVTKTERGVIMLPNESGALEARISRRQGRVTPEAPFDVSSKIPREVFATGRPRVVRDLLNATGHDDTNALDIRHVMCVPLRLGALPAEAAGDAADRVIGVLYLDSRDPRSVPSADARASLETFATEAAIAIQSAQLYAEAVENARMDRDLRIAADIQRTLLGDPAYTGPICDLAAVSIPSRTIGGDFFDYLDFSGDRFTFAVGDVAGKGPPAALLAVAVQSHFMAQTSVNPDPARTLANINAALLRRVIEGRFATMFHGVLTPDGRLCYSNGGQEPPLAISRHGLRWLEVGGPVVGLFSVAVYEEETVQLAPDDLVVVFSDGVTEATNASGEQFGRARVAEAVERCHGARPETVLEALLEAVRAFSRGAPQADDITVLILRYRISQPEPGEVERKA